MMNSTFIQLLVLAGIAVFLLLKLRAVLGSRDGFEPKEPPAPSLPNRRNFEVIEGGEDRDITDHVHKGSAAATALAQMKAVEPSFNVSEFLKGARGAYEMILMSFEHGKLDDIRPFLSDEVRDSFGLAIQQRENLGHGVTATFAGIRDLALASAEYDATTQIGEITVRMTGELTRLVRDASGQIVSGAANEIIRQRDTWTFARSIGTNDPNWQLVATGD